MNTHNQELESMLSMTSSLKTIAAAVSKMAKLQPSDLNPLDDHHYNELVQAVGIIRAAADGAKCNLEDGHPVNHIENYQTILRATDRLAKVIRHIRGYDSVSFEAVKAEWEAEGRKNE